MADLGKLLQLAAHKKLLLNNLFQIEPDKWRCNLRTTGGKTTGFGNGATPEEALKAAMLEVEWIEKPTMDDLLS